MTTARYKLKQKHNSVTDKTVIGLEELKMKYISLPSADRRGTRRTEWYIHCQTLSQFCLCLFFFVISNISILLNVEGAGKYKQKLF